MKVDTHSYELERRASQFQGDGLLDIGLGLALIIVGLAIYGDWTMSFVGIWVILWMFGGRAAKRRITLPRMPLIDYSPSPDAARRRSYLKRYTIGLIFLIFMLSFLLFAFGDRLPDQYMGLLEDSSALVLGLIGLGVVVLLGLAGWATGAPRLLVYAGLGILGGIAAVWFGVNSPLILTALGVVILAVGISLLIRFLQDYSMPQR